MATRQLPEPDFADSRDLRRYCNETRKVLHGAAMHLHMSANELEAALSTIPPAEGGMFAKAAQRRRAKRVAKHMRHAAECMVAGSSAVVRTWGAFRAEFAPEISPNTRGRRAAFKVVQE